jgi:hypothetical protein
MVHPIRKLGAVSPAALATALQWNNVAPPSSQRRFRSSWPDDGAANITTADQLICVYVGKTTQPTTCKFVEFYISIVGLGAQTAEVGLFSSPSAPNKAGQNLTCLAVDGTLDSLLVGTGTKRNTTAFSAGAGFTVPDGTHIWAGLRTNMATTQPNVVRLLVGMKDGSVLQTNTAGVIALGGVYAGTVLVDGTQPPNLQIAMD